MADGAHDRGVRPAQWSRRPAARADRWRHRRLAGSPQRPRSQYLVPLLAAEVAADQVDLGSSPRGPGKAADGGHERPDIHRHPAPGQGQVRPVGPALVWRRRPGPAGTGRHGRRQRGDTVAALLDAQPSHPRPRRRGEGAGSVDRQVQARVAAGGPAEPAAKLPGRVLANLAQEGERYMPGRAARPAKLRPGRAQAGQPGLDLVERAGRRRDRHEQPHTAIGSRPARPARPDSPARTPRRRARTAAMTAVAASEIRPPATMLIRGPKRSATQPTKGDPSGAPPRKTSRYRPMTRPRMSGVVASCMAELAAVVKVMTASPTGTSSTRKDQNAGISPSATSIRPKAADVPSSSPRPGLARRAASSAPASAPAA